MNTLRNLARAALLVVLLWLIPVSQVVAQSHKGRQHSTGQQAARADKPRVAPPASAGTPPSKGANPQATSTPPGPGQPPPAQSSEQLVKSLHSAKAHLDQAVRDDPGHRTRALQEVGNAIKLLSPPGDKTNPIRNGLDRPGGEVAATSKLAVASGATSADPHLGEAQRLLRAAEAAMNGNGVNAHRTIKARDAVQNAIRELNLALVEP